MLREVVQSQLLRSVGHSKSDRLLEIEFVSGRVYLYRDVPREAYQALLHAKSAGAHFNEHIRDHFSAAEV